MNTIIYSFSHYDQRGGYCSKTQDFPPLSLSVRSLEEATQKIDHILNGDVLCGHDIKDMEVLYDQMVKFEWKMKEIPKESSSKTVIDKIHNKIRDALSAEYTPQGLTNLYHLSRFREVAQLKHDLTNTL